MDCVLDVGANKGQYAKYLRKRAYYQGMIISFEPVAANFQALQAAAAMDPNWFVLPYALGSEARDMDINVMENDTLSSFHTPDASTDIVAGNTVIERETVKVMRLRDALAEVPGALAQRRFYLKMDTQGYDLEVMKGAADMLDSIVALQSEISMIPIYEGTPDFADSIRTIRGFGFGVSALAPVNVKNDQALEFDCIMVNKSLA